MGLGLTAPAPARASCVGPSITVVGATTHVATSTPGPSLLMATVRVGETVDVKGIFFFDSCNDTDSADGCSGPGAEDPSRDVPLVLTQGTRSWTLGKAEAGDAATKYASEWKARIPSDVALGSATLTA